MAQVSPNMGLRVWDSNDDTFESQHLASNFMKLDFHDHSGGRGSQIPTEGFKDGAISSGKLADTATLKALGSFSAYRNGALTGHTTGSTVIFDAEEWDLSSWYSIGSGQFTPLLAGYYRVNVVATVSTDIAASATNFWELGVTKNGTIAKYSNRFNSPSATTADTRVGVTTLISCNGTTDYISVKTNSSGNLDFVTGAANTYFQGELVGRL